MTASSKGVVYEQGNILMSMPNSKNLIILRENVARITSLTTKEYVGRARYNFSDTFWRLNVAFFEFQ